jgi:hypothetical protein
MAKHESLGSPKSLAPEHSRGPMEKFAWGAIHQFLNIILKLRILVLLPVSNLPYVVEFKNYSLIGEQQLKNRFLTAF